MDYENVKNNKEFNLILKIYINENFNYNKLYRNYKDQKLNINECLNNDEFYINQNIEVNTKNVKNIKNMIQNLYVMKLMNY